MDRKFDLRLQADRDDLASFLPSVDGRTIDIPPAMFVGALKDAADFLGNPEWLTYQWGTVGPYRQGNNVQGVELRRLAELGLELRDLSKHKNFDGLVSQFSNPSQFFDTMFEVRVASLFSRLVTTERMEFCPPYVVRDRRKHPDFDFFSPLGLITVECKRPHTFVQRAAETFNSSVNAIHEALKAVDWSPDLRLEVEIIAPLRESLESFGKGIVHSAIGLIQAGRVELTYGAARVIVVPRKSPYQITDVKFWQDVMVIDDEPTGLLNPDKTMLRVANNRLDHKFERSTSANIAEALRQLPDDHWGIIVLGEVSHRIADAAIERRIGDKAFDKVLAFVIYENEQFHFKYGSNRRKDIQQLLGPGIRPLNAVLRTPIKVY
jgi:hypothetical protein